MNRAERRAHRLALGALALASMPALAFGADGPPAAAARAVVVRLAPARFLVDAVAPDGWSSPAFDDRGWSGPAPGPFVPRALLRAAAPPASAGTPFDARAGASLFLRARFDVDAPTRARVLELQVRYADGFIAYVNGREVARRGLGADAGAHPLFPHGPEVEHVYVPVTPALTGALGAAGNLLALEIRPAISAGGASSPVSPAGDVGLVAAAGVRIVRGPYLIAPTDGAAGAGLSIAWETDLPATGKVTVTPADARGEAPRVLPSGPPALRQVVALTGLDHGRRYRYSLRATAGAAPGDADEKGPFVFTTFADRSKPFRFAIYGDMRAPGHEDHRRVVERLLTEEPALVVNTGDLVALGSEESDWQKYFEITAPLGASAPVVPALGNHDAGRAGLGAPKTWALFGLPSAAPATSRPGWTSLDLGGVHIVILDSEQAANDAQKQWLVADLARARRAGARAIFAVLHEGPWAHGVHGGTASVEHELTPVLAAAGVDVLFAGHDHIYERGVGATPKGRLPYVITGGGGAPLYPPSCAPPSGGEGTVGRPPCPRSVVTLSMSFHYVMVEVGAKGVTLCPKRPDGSPLEPCVTLARRR